MKKTAALFAALCIAVSCSGCAKKTNAENSAAQTQNLNETGFSYTGLHERLCYDYKRRRERSDRRQRG